MVVSVMHAFHLRLNQKERFIGYYPDFSCRLNTFYIAICCLRRLHHPPTSTPQLFELDVMSREQIVGEKKKKGGAGGGGGWEKVVKKERKRCIGFIKFTFSPLHITKILSEH